MSKRYSVPDEQPTHVGEGITYTTKPGARLWALEVPFPGNASLRCTVRAISQRQAVQFAAARHPNANPERIRVLSKSEAGGLL
jgi:hypothetical protein